MRAHGLVVLVLAVVALVMVVSLATALAPTLSRVHDRIEQNR